MLDNIKKINPIRKLRKSAFYSRIRQYLPMSELEYIDDRDRLEDAVAITIDWPKNVKKPIFGIVQDYGGDPRWTKYHRFLDNNSFRYDIYNIHSHNWIEKAAEYDIIIGFPSSELCHLEEMRRKYYFLETYLGKTCYPSSAHSFLYEDKSLEAFISKVAGIPFVNTYVSHDRTDALRLIEELNFPIVSKIVPSSGSMGMELVVSPKHCRKIINQAFSRNGRKTHRIYFQQKNYIYFQDFIPNDGFDIRAIVVGDCVFGYYRKVPEGDFRASGMNLVEKRGLPQEAIRIARKVNKIIDCPMLVVDMLHGLDGEYYVIEFSPICQIETSEQLHVDGVPGVYVFEDDESIHFLEGRYWVHELALREMLLNDYLPKIVTEKT